MRSRKKVLKYWTGRRKHSNGPKRYVRGKKRSLGLVEEFKKLDIKEGDSILELGCNVGRNLWFLQKAGYNHLFGVEVNLYAIEMSRDYFPKLEAGFILGDMETVLPALSEKQVVFSMATLCHVHPSVEENVFKEMMRIAQKYIIIIEDEVKSSGKHCVRDYSKCFPEFELIKREESFKGMNDKFRLSIFEKM
jgi:SAM-dependent methyltransferase